MRDSAPSTLFMVLFLISATFVKADTSLQDQYLRVYVKFHDAENLEKEKDYLGALINFKSALSYLIRMHDLDANWEATLVNKRIQDGKDEIAKLVPPATKQLLDQPRLADPAGPVDSTLWDDGFQQEKDKNYWHAVDQFQSYVTIVEIMKHLDARWDTPQNAKRLDQAKVEIERLEQMELQLQFERIDKNPGIQ